jgi:hypothetical protein
MSDERGTVKREGSLADRRRPRWAAPVIAGVLIVLVVGATFAVVLLKANYDASRRDEGRRDSTLVFCSIASGIVEQGQVLLVSGTLRRGDQLDGVPPTPVSLQRALLTTPINDLVGLYKPGPISKEIGDPSPESFKRRLLAARTASEQYAQGIADRVAKVAGTEPQRVSAGSTGIDCDKILKLAKVN